MQCYTFVRILLLNPCIHVLRYVHNILIKLSYIRYPNKNVDSLLPDPMRTSGVTFVMTV